MALENLFATEPALPSMQKMKLPEDVKTWGEAITTLLKQKFPDLANVAIEIEFRKKDDPTGSAVGAAHVINDEAQKTMCIPLVIKRFELSPLDVWMEKDSQAVHPITADTFKEQFFTPQSAQGLDNRPTDSQGQYFNDPSMWTSTYPPLQGRYAYASGGYRLLDLIEDSMAKEDLMRFRADLAKHAYVIPQYAKLPNGRELLQKLARKESKKSFPNTNDFKASARKMIPMSVAEVKRNGNDRYSVLAYADNLFDLAESYEMNRDACQQFLSKITAHAADVLHEVDQTGEKMLVTKPVSDNGVFLYDDMPERPEVAKEFGAYHVKTKSGNSLEGVVLPLVVDFKGKKQSVKLFISKNHSSMQGSIAGIKNDNSTCLEACLKPAAVRVGQTGTFVFIDDGKALATIPVTIKAIEKHAEYPICAYTLDGKKLRIKQSYSDDYAYGTTPAAPGKKPKNFLDAHAMIEMKPEHFIIPSRMVWIPMERFQDVSATPAAWMEGEASVKLASRAPSTMRMFDKDSFELDVGYAKFAGTKRDMQIKLAQMGAPSDVAERFFKKVAKAKKGQIYGLKKLSSVKDLDSRADATYGQLVKICEKIKTSFVKEAAQLIKTGAEVEDTETVDTLLSLNFLNPDNLAQFVSFRPVFEKVADYLAQITLASRLGLHDIDEAASTGAMRKMLDVNDGLRRVETAMGGNPDSKPLQAQDQK